MRTEIRNSSLVRFGITRITLRDRIEAAKKSRNTTVPISVETAERFLALLEEIEGMTGDRT